jgi:hypothetical protein
LAQPERRAGRKGSLSFAPRINPGFWRVESNEANGLTDGADGVAVDYLDSTGRLHAGKRCNGLHPNG